VDLYNAIIRLRPDWHDEDDSRGAIKVVMTGSASDLLPMQPHIRNKARREKLAERFKDVKQKLGPDQTAITVQTEDGVRYEDLVRVIDECIGDEFPAVSVSPMAT